VSFVEKMPFVATPLNSLVSQTKNSKVLTPVNNLVRCWRDPDGSTRLLALRVAVQHSSCATGCLHVDATVGTPQSMYSAKRAIKFAERLTVGQRFPWLGVVAPL